MSNILKISDVPFLMKQWSPLNEESPDNISVGSHKVFKWKCNTCGYEWSSSAKSRYASGGKCPCHESNKVIVSGINDVFTLFPILKDYYDTEKNNAEGIDVSKEGLDSCMLVNWKCPDCKRQWKTSIKSRTRKENGERVVVHCPHYNTVKRKKDEVPTINMVSELYRFWDTDKNPDASTVKSNSTGYMYWKCANCSYEWYTTVVSQASGSGKCACCELNIVTKKGYNDIFTLIPESEKYYDFDKNTNVDIYSMGIRNKQPLWWKCPDCGHNWQSSIASRVDGKRGNYSFRGCQQCYFKDPDRITPASSSRLVVRYWDYEKNKGHDINLTSLYSKESMYWKCKDCGYTWKASVYGLKNSNGCPFCNNPDHFISNHPNIIEALNNIFDTSENPEVNLLKLRLNTTATVHFHCKNCNYTWNGKLGNRIRKNEDGSYRLLGCPMCDNNARRKQTYAEQYPELTTMYNEEKSGRSLASITSYESNAIKLMWNCKTCHRTFTSRLQSMINSLNTSSKGCPYCSNTILSEGESFGDLHPELILEYASENAPDPFKVFPNSKTPVMWKCQNNPDHTWDAPFSLRHKGGGNCPICNRTQLIQGVNTFSDVYPEFLDMYAESNERKPNEIFYNSTLWFRWNCRTCQSEYGAYIEDVISGRESCPYCSNRYVKSGLNDLKTIYPDIASMWSDNNETNADGVFPTSSLGVIWNCPDCGGEYKARISEVVNGSYTCPFCSGRRVLSGFNDFATKHPELMNEYDYTTNYITTDSNAINVKSHKLLWWICPKNSEHRYYMSPTQKLWYQKRHRESCPYCKGLRRKKRHFI